MAKTEVLYNGTKIQIQCDENDKLETIFSKLGQKIEKKEDDLVFLYGGKLVDKNLTFNGLANSLDKERKTVSIIAVDDNDKKDNSTLLKENKELKEKLNEANKTIEEQKKEIQELKNQISMIKSEDMKQINSLNQIIEKIEKENKQLKDSQKNIVNDTPKKIFVQFNSFGNEVNCAIPCLETDIFSEVEEKLYEKYPKFKKYKTTFICNGFIIQKFETIKENKIKNGDLVNMSYI